MKPWTEEEKRIALSMRRPDGKFNRKAIARKLGRSIISVEGFLAYQRMSTEGRRHRNIQRMRRKWTLQGKDVSEITRFTRPDPETLAERDWCLSRGPRDLTAALLGDPLPGRSALERRA